jgi:hypothetical protein
MSERSQIDLNPPLPLFAQWYGVLVGPLVFGFDLVVSYALVPHACSTGHWYVLHAMTVACLLVIFSGWFTSWALLRRIPRDMPERGDKLMSRARFMALAGLMLSGFSIVLVIANELPRFLMSPCD